MSPILGIYASQISGHLYAASFESLQTVTVGAGGASSVTFSSIPSTYKHLQIRMFSQAAYSTSDYDSIAMRFNGDTGNNYSYHILRGNGTNAASAGNSSYANAFSLYTSLVSGSSSVFGASITDILDYSNTSKYKTLRGLGGVDWNTGGGVGLASSLWMNTAAINSITLFDTNGNWNQYSQFALYGIKEVA